MSKPRHPPTIGAVLLVLLGLTHPLRAQETTPRLTSGTHSQSLTVNGIRRTYELHVPPAYDGKEVVPLVVVLHDRGGSGKDAARAYGMSEKADREGFLVAYPDALGSPRSWNTGYMASSPNADDAAFLRTLIARLTQTLAIDRRKVFVAGHGRGGVMAYHLGAEFASRIAAIGVVGGAAGVKAIGGVVTPPRPTVPVSVIAFHGQKDNTMPYEGGVFLSAKASIAFWVRQNECATVAPKAESHNGRVLRETYTDCDEETEVTLYTLVDGDHRWPGAAETRPSGLPPDAPISATDLMWDFFKRHHR